METLTKPKEKTYKVRCENDMCRAVMSCTIQELKHEQEWDGMRHWLVCPHCMYKTRVRA